MKRIISMIMVVMTILTSMTFMSGCTEPVDFSEEGDFEFNKRIREYEVSTHFLFSTEGDYDAAYSEKTQEVPVGEPFWTRITVQIGRTRGVLVEKIVDVYVTIPDTEVSDFKLVGAVTEDLKYDGNGRYTCKVAASTNPQTYYLTFRGMPLAEGDTPITVTYDDEVSDTLSHFKVITYVDKDVDSNNGDGLEE